MRSKRNRYLCFVSLWGQKKAPFSLLFLFNPFLAGLQKCSSHTNMVHIKNPRKRNATPMQKRRTSKNRMAAIQRQIDVCETALLLIIEKHGSEENYREKILNRTKGCKDKHTKQVLSRKANRNLTKHIETLKARLATHKANGQIETRKNTKKGR